MVAKLTQRDFDFAAQFGVTHPGLVRLLRQVRLLARLFGVNLEAAASNSVSAKYHPRAK
jgi:hypothetical protein